MSSLQCSNDGINFSFVRVSHSYCCWQVCGISRCNWSKCNNLRFSSYAVEVAIDYRFEEAESGYSFYKIIMCYGHDIVSLCSECFAYGDYVYNCTIRYSACCRSKS